MRPADLVAGMAVKAVIMMIAALGCMLAAKLGGNYVVRQNPDWSKAKKEAAHSLVTFAAVVVFAVFIIGIARG